MFNGKYMKGLVQELGGWDDGGGYCGAWGVYMLMLVCACVCVV